MNNSDSQPQQKLDNKPQKIVGKPLKIVQNRRGHESDRKGVRCNSCKKRGHLAADCQYKVESSKDDLVARALSEAAQQKLGEADARADKFKEQYQQLADEKEALKLASEEASAKLKIATMSQPIEFTAPSGNTVESFNFVYEPFQVEMKRVLDVKMANLRWAWVFTFLTTCCYCYSYIAVFFPWLTLVDVLFQINGFFPFLGLLGMFNWMWKTFALSFLIGKSNLIKELVQLILSNIEVALRIVVDYVLTKLGLAPYLLPILNGCGGVLPILFALNVITMVQILLYNAHYVYTMDAWIRKGLLTMKYRDTNNPTNFLGRMEWYTHSIATGYFKIRNEIDEISVIGAYGLSNKDQSFYNNLYLGMKTMLRLWFAPFTVLTLVLLHILNRPVYIRQSIFARSNKNAIVRDLGTSIEPICRRKIYRKLVIHPDLKDKVKMIDNRPDNMSFSKLKHDDPIYSKFEFSYHTFGDVEYKYAGPDRTGVMSLELFMQLTTPSIVNMIDDVDSIKFRLNRSSQNFHGVNVDKFQVLCGEDIVGNTIDCVFHFYKYRKHINRNAHAGELFYQPQGQ